MEFWILAIVLLLILGAEFVNGWTDAPNAIATVVSTKILPPKIAILFATTLNIFGVFSGTAVAATIGKGIIFPDSVSLTTVAAAMFAIISWSTFAWWYDGLPTSESHALVAGLSGAALATAGPSALLWDGWSKVLIGLLFSTVFGCFGGWTLAKLIRYFFAETSPGKSKRTFGRLQIFSAGLMAFSHGSNDGQKFIGVFALALLLGGVTESFSVPYWIIIVCAVVMGLGTSLGGMKIIKTMGFRTTKLETYQGFSAETSAASTILLASHLGIPLSTTHTISTSIFGVGAAKGLKSVRLAIVSKIVYAWFLTFPVCGLLAFISAKLLHLLF